MGCLDKLLQNNGGRIREMERYATKGLMTVFHLVPILLHINHPEVPGYIDDENLPRGVVGLVDQEFHRKVMRLFPSLRGEGTRSLNVPRPAVESLVVMGSSGSVGHTSSSDLDYWVCLDGERLGPERIRLFRIKLNRLTEWAAARYKAEVNFYIIGLKDLAENKFSSPEGESEGDVAPRLLKEEFYRTLVWAAGRLPLWWTVPSDCGPDEYRELAGASGGEGGRYVDFGYPERPGPREYMSAALWLSRKSEANPFKGVLKMLLILEQVEADLGAPLLCDEMKRLILAAPEDRLPIDPYALAINRALEFAEKSLAGEFVELARIAAFYKVRGPLDFSGLSPESPKARFLDGLAEKWSWDRKKIDRLNNFTSWSEPDRQRLGQDFKAMIYEMYSNTAKRLMEEYPDEVKGVGLGMMDLKSRMLTRFSEHHNKIEELPSSIHRQTLPRQMTLYYDQLRWRLYGGRIESKVMEPEHYQDRLLFECGRAARAAAWLVYNRLFDPDLKLSIRPRPGPVSLDTLFGLLRMLAEHFPPMDAEKLRKEKGLKLGGQGSRLLVINLEEPAGESRLASADLFYRMAWGEMRHLYFPVGHLEKEAEKYLAVADQILSTGRPEIADLNFYSPPNPAGRKIANNIKVAVLQTLKGSGTGAKTAGRLRLDAD